MHTKKILAYILAAIVVIVTVVSVLAIWDIIDLKNVTSKLVKSLIVVFLSSVVILFIYGVVLNDNKKWEKDFVSSFVALLSSACKTNTNVIFKPINHKVV